MKTAAVALALVGAVTADQTVKFEFNGGALEASLIGHAHGGLEFVTPAGGCVYRGNWCGDWLDTACVMDTDIDKHTGINFSRGGARAVLYENGVLAFESDNGCVNIEETAAPAGGWTPIAGNKGQLGFASGDVDTKEVHSRIHVKPNGELWISAKNLHDMVPPTSAPTEYPTAIPTTAPTAYPTAAPTDAPTAYPTASPTEAPTTAYPTASPTEAPTEAAKLDTKFYWIRCVHPDSYGCEFQWTDADGKCRETSFPSDCQSLPGTDIFGKDHCGAAVCSVTQPVETSAYHAANYPTGGGGRSGNCDEDDWTSYEEDWDYLNPNPGHEFNPCYGPGIQPLLRTTCPTEAELSQTDTTLESEPKAAVAGDGCNAGRRLGE